MTDTPAVTKAAEAEVLSDIPDSSSAVFESPDTLKTATSSSHHDSEYDTASDTPSSDLEDEDDFEDDDVDDNGEEGSVVLDLDRQNVDGDEDGEKKKVDDDEDRSNPQYIPKRGVFYEHDDRTAEEPEADRKTDEEGKEEKSDSPTPAVKKPVKKSAAAADRWSHDRYNENEQAPKSRSELVNSYGYDIRNEDGPPRARRRRRYGRGPNKYTRNWEDEKAYAKLSSQQEKQQQLQQRNPQDEFPELGSRKAKPSAREEKENKNDENRRSNKSPNQRSQQSHQEGGHRSDRYDQSYGNDIFDGGNRQHDDRRQNYEMSRSQSDGNRSHDAGRSQNDRFDGNRSKFFDNNRQNDRYEGNRQQNDHYDNNRSNSRYDGTSRYSNDQNERNERNQNDRYDNKRSSDKFDGNRIDRYDQRMERGGGGDKGNWDRRGGKINDNRSGGYRTGKTIEYTSKNQNRSHHLNNAPPPQSQSGSKGFASSGYNQRQNQSADYESELPVESLSFTNSKLSAAAASSVPPSMNDRYSSNVVDYGQMDRPERPITGRQMGASSSRNSNQMQQQSSLPIVNPIHTQQPSMNIQQQISSQPIQQQTQLLPQQNSNLMASESRSAKRYSTLRQRTTEAVQNLSIPQHLHEQQMLLQDAALILQMQQSQEQIQIQPNLAHQPPATSYSAQPMPLQMQNEYAALGQPKSQAPGSAQTSQQPLMQTPGPNQSASQSAQYPSPYFASNEFAGQSTSIQPAAQPYPAQYPQQPTAPPPSYVQPPPQASYIQPAVNQQQQQQQQQQLMNYVPTIPPAQQPFSAVQSFPTYPPSVPNYNPVPSGITQSGITYYPPTAQQPRPILSQRRPTNAIPILAPSERFAGKGRNRQSNNQYDDDDKTALNPPIGSPENIDHILDNMFTQRAPFQPPTRKSNSPSPESNPKVGDNQSEAIQSNVTGAFDGGNKQLEFVDAGIGKMSIDEISKMDNAIAPIETVTDSAAS